jgi:Periplasmic binding protein
LTAISSTVQPMYGSRGRAARLAVGLVTLCAMGRVSAACQRPGAAPVIVKVGVIAPFEGLGRQLGYAILPVIKAELAEANMERPLGHFRVALVSLNDDHDPGEAAAQARALVRDPDVKVVIGGWSDETARSAVPILADAGVPTLLAMPSDGLGPTTISLCPAPDQLAAEILRRAGRLGMRNVVVTGSDTPLRRALLSSDPAPELVPDSAPFPCAASAAADCPVIHAGDAADAAETLRRWRASSWDGDFLGGPDIARPWFTGQAGRAAEGTRAVVCGSLGPLLPGQDASLQNAEELAGAATRSVLAVLDRAIQGTGDPTRRSIAGVLSSSAFKPDLAWLEVRDERWVPLHE